MEIRIDNGPNGQANCFTQPQNIIEAWDITALAPALADLDAAAQSGQWLAGYASYELGYALEPKLTHLLPENRRLPLLRFGVYDAPKPAGDLPQDQAEFGPFTPDWDLAEYTKGFTKAHDYIGAGDIYQTNLTFPLWADALGSSAALYSKLVQRQNVKYGALIEQDGLPDILCRSPELFFRTYADGQIEAHPMKGTQPRAQDPIIDKQNRDFLLSDHKNKAENLMIVDLLRNDLSRISQPGTVKVPALFEVQSFATLHQMVSKITAQMRDDITTSDIFRALFPCGSITGAPKIRAMEIIRELEPNARDIYCGAIGWMAPDGRSEFSVAIRTLLVENGRARLNVGGGLVWDSTAASEYEEALWKTRFANQSPLARS